MARGGLDFVGIDFSAVTMKANTAMVSMATISGVAAVEGKAVTITANGEVGFGVNGNKLFGRVDKYESDGYVTVQHRGYAELPGVSGSLPVAGDFLVVDGAGAVKASAGAVGPAKAVSVDSTTNKVIVLIA